MHKLLVPFDSSENSKRALKYALDLASGNGPIELLIVHAHDSPIVYGEIALYVPPEKAAEHQRRHSEDILRPAIEMAKAAGVRFTSDILVGDISKSIVACAESQSCDGIVMGTRGMSAMGNLLLGSVATKVVHLTKLPVTLIK